MIAALVSAALAAAVADAQPCRAVDAPLAVAERAATAELLQRVQAYRAGWRAFCRAPPQEGRSLAGLFGDAVDLGKVLDVSGPAAVDATVATWLPAFRAAAGGHAVVDMEAFGRYAGRGTEDDRDFFAGYRRVWGDAPDLPAWLRRGRGPKPCLRLGDFDWAGAVRAARSLGARLAPEVYRDALKALEDRMAGDLYKVTTRGRACACRRTRRPLEGLERLARDLEHESAPSPLGDAVPRLLRGLRDRSIAVRYAGRGGCS